MVQASISQYDVENGRSACTCICLEASLSILEQMAKGLWTGSPDDVAVSRAYIRRYASWLKPSDTLVGYIRATKHKT